MSADSVSLGSATAGIDQAQRLVNRQLQVRELWSVPLGDSHTNSPLKLRDGSTLVTSKDGAFLVPQGGGQTRFLDTGDCSDSQPLEGEDGRLYIPNYDGFLTAYDPASGQSWSRKLGGVKPWSVSLRQQGEQLLVAERDRLLTLNLDGSEAKPPRPLEFAGRNRDHTSFMPDGKLLVRSIQDNKYALGILDHEGKLEATLHSEIAVNRTPAGGFVVQNEGRLKVYEADGKTEVFSVKPPEGFGPKTAVAEDGSVSYITHNRLLHYSAEGEIVRDWQAPEGSRPTYVASSPDTSYVMCFIDGGRGRQSKIHAITSGGQRWERQVKGARGLSLTAQKIPVVVGQLLPLEVLDPHTGKSAQAPSASNYGKPPFVEEGGQRILTTTRDNRLMALAVEYATTPEFSTQVADVEVEMDENLIVIGDFDLQVN